VLNLYDFVRSGHTKTKNDLYAEANEVEAASNLRV